MTEAAPPLTAFLTDASIIAMADAIAQMCGARVSLRDHQGRRIVRTDSAPHWSLLGPDPLTVHIARALGENRNGFAVGETLYPMHSLHVDGTPAGAFIIESKPANPAHALPLGRCLAHLCTVIDEFCTRELSLQARNEELGLLHRVLSALTASRDAEQAADAAIRQAAEHFAADAGLIHLVSSTSAALDLAASVGLTDANTSLLRAIPLPEGGDAPLTAAGDGLVRQAAQSQRLPQIATVELRFAGRPFGVLRLLWREAATLDASDRELIRTIAAQAADAIGRIRLAYADRHARRQFKLASDVQHRMLPNELPHHPRLDIAARFEPSLDIGGDFYDVFRRDGAIAFVAGDVVGKGVPAGLLMASVRASLRAHASGSAGVAEIMARVNDDMARDTLPNEFATLVMGQIDADARTLVYCNAGHEPPLLIREGGQSHRVIDQLEAGGMVVGVQQHQQYDQGVAPLRPGDVLVCVTDGVIEAMDFAGMKYGRARLLETLRAFLREYPEAPARLLVDHIVWDVRRFAGLAPQSDDTTVLVVRITA